MYQLFTDHQSLCDFGFFHVRIRFFPAERFIYVDLPLWVGERSQSASFFYTKTKNTKEKIYNFQSQSKSIVLTRRSCHCFLYFFYFSSYNDANLDLDLGTSFHLFVFFWSQIMFNYYFIFIALLINRLGVAGAVPQRPSWFINSLTNWLVLIHQIIKIPSLPNCMS